MQIDWPTLSYIATTAVLRFLQKLNSLADRFKLNIFIYMTIAIYKML
jgi:hypothetical protein